MTRLLEHARTQLRRRLPDRVKRAIRPGISAAREHRYASNLSQLGTHRDELLVLGTIEKSGTHYMKFLMSNYVLLLDGSSDGPVGADEMNRMLPNTWHKAYLGPRTYSTPTRHLALLGLHDIPRAHIPYHPWWRNTRVLHLFRNPLDYAVSLFFYMYRNRTDVTDEIAGPPEVLDIRFDRYVSSYLSYRQAAGDSRARVLRISYEDLMTSPVISLRTVLRWLGVEPVQDLVEIAVRYSSRESISEIEAKGGMINPGAKNFTGKFVRDGSIGQWREHFSDFELQQARERFASVGIDLDEFTLDEPALTDRIR